MGCIPSKKSLNESPVPTMPTTSPKRPPSPSSIDTKVDADRTFSASSGAAPIPPRVDCIAPRPRPSEESLRRRKAHDDQAHQESATTATATATAVAGGAAVDADNGGSGGDDGGGGSSGGGGGGGE